MLHAAYEGVSYRAPSWGQRVDAPFSGRGQGSVPWLRSTSTLVHTLSYGLSILQSEPPKCFLIHERVEYVC